MKLTIFFVTILLIYQNVFCCPSSPNEKHSVSQTTQAKTDSDSGLQTTKAKTDSDQSKEPSKYMNIV